MEPAAPRDSLPEHASQAARAFKPKRRRLIIALLANLALVVTMVGGPYLRGHLRARELWRLFGEAAACILGGRVSADPGLGLPHGSSERFARLLLSASDPEWPDRCEPWLAALDLPPATFLLPSVKTAELDVDATAELVRVELAQLSRWSRGVRVPDRPLRALDHLRAALARHAHAVGVLRLPDQDAIVFDDANGDVAAARVPLYASADAQVWWTGTAQTLTALALDRRSLSYVEVRDGTLIQRRHDRPHLLRTLLAVSDHRHTLLWAMRPNVCAEREDRCRGKAVGVASLALPFDHLPPPRWLAGHPAGRADRHMSVVGDDVQVLVATAEGGLQVERFALAGPSSEGESAAPLGADSRWPALAGVGAGLLLGADRGVIAHRRGTTTTRFLFQPPGAEAQPLAELDGEGGWSVACADGRAGAIGTAVELRAFRFADDASTPVLSPVVRAPVAEPVHAEEAYRDRVRVLCEVDPPVVLLRAADDVLLALRCGGEVCEKHPLARHVRWFDGVLAEGRLVVAYAGSGEHAQILVRGISLSDGRAEPALAPDPCWADGGGLCGLPRLLWAGGRLLLGAREGSDLRLMESADAGRHWTPMRGLRKAAAL